MKIYIFDIDDTLLDFSYYFIKSCNIVLGKEINYKWSNKNRKKCDFDNFLSKKEKKRIHNFIELLDGLEHLTMHPYARQLLKYCYSEGQIIYLTSRPENFRKSTYQFFVKNRLPIPSGYNINDKVPLLMSGENYNKYEHLKNIKNIGKNEIIHIENNPEDIKLSHKIGVDRIYTFETNYVKRDKYLRNKDNIIKVSIPEENGLFEILNHIKNSI